MLPPPPEQAKRALTKGPRPVAWCTNNVNTISLGTVAPSAASSPAGWQAAVFPECNPGLSLELHSQILHAL